MFQQDHCPFLAKDSFHLYGPTFCVATPALQTSHTSSTTVAIFPGWNIDVISFPEGTGAHGGLWTKGSQHGTWHAKR